MATTRASRPSSSFGYWRGGMPDGPLWQNQGSGYGPNIQGTGVLPPGVGQATGGGAWTPTIIYLFIMVAAELVIAGCLARWLK